MMPTVAGSRSEVSVQRRNGALTGERYPATPQRDEDARMMTTLDAPLHA
jgi:hypothetical protein